MSIDRRTFLGSVAGVSLTAGCGRRPLPPPPPPPAGLPDPAKSGIDHIVVVTMENRSFDHLFGWLPNANGIPAQGLTYPDRSGKQNRAYHLQSDFTGCGHHDPDHSYSGARICYAGGAMNGFLRDTSNDLYAIGYYYQADLPFYSALAQSFTAYDNWHAAILGPTFPNRMFIWAAQTDRITDSIPFTALPTIFDALGDAHVSHRYYFSNLPYLAFWGLKYIFSTSLFSHFLSDAAAGNLPSVSFVDPKYTVLDDGSGNDDHPHADVRNGDAFLASVFHAVATGPKWASTVLVVIFDEWGGFFDHVPPPRVVAPANSPDTDLVNGAALLGFRIPAVIASPFTKGIAGSQNQVDHRLYDHTSALKLIEWRFGLSPLTARNASALITNPAVSFNFKSPDPSLPPLPKVSPVSAPACFGNIFNAAPAPGQTAARSGTGQPNAWAAFAKSPAAQQFLAHPHIQSLSKP